MKKTLMLTLLTAGALCMSSHAQESVYSANVVGFQQVELQPDGGAQIMAAPFETGENTLLDVFGTNNLRQSDFLVATDRIILYDENSQTYQQWAQWTDGNFYKANNASEWNAAIPGNPEIPVDTGFWIISAGASETNNITFIGDVISSTNRSVALIEGFQLVGYPFSSDLDLSETPHLVSSGASSSDFLVEADRITTYDPASGSYQIYALWTDGNWYKANDASEWNQGIPADKIIDAGSGFWYQSVNEFTWNEPIPYPNLND